MPFKVNHCNYIISGDSGVINISLKSNRVSMLLLENDCLYVKKNDDESISLPYYHICEDVLKNKNTLKNIIMEESNILCDDIVDIGVSQNLENLTIYLMSSKISRINNSTKINLEKICIKEFEKCIFNGVTKDSIAIHLFYLAKQRGLL